MEPIQLENMENSANEQAAVGQNSSHNFKKIFLILVVLVFLGGIGYAYYMRPSRITLGEAVVNTLDAIRDSKIKSAEFIASIDADVDFTKVDEQSKELGRFPSGGLNGVKLSISSNGIVDNTEREGTKAYGKINLNFKIDAPDGSPVSNMLSGEPLITELEYYLFPDSIYFKINKVPSIVDTYASAQGIKLSGYLNQWFVLNETEISLFRQGFWKGFNDVAKKDNVDFGGKNPFALNLSDESYSKLKLSLLEYFDQSGAVVVVDRKKETIDGQRVIALYTKLDKDKYLSAVKNIREDLREILPESFTNILEEMDSDMENESSFLNADSSIKIFVGSDGYLHGQAGSIDIPATDDIPGVSEDIYFGLKNYNKSFKLQKPADARIFFEAFKEIMQPS